MSEEKNLPEELKQLETELAALSPRRDGLDPHWRAFLGKAAELNVGEPADHAACSAPDDHLFLCVYCGASRPRASRARRWAWPGAFSAITATAAFLLVLLAVHPQFRPIPHAVPTADGDRSPYPGDSSGRTPSSSELQFTWMLPSGPRWREERLCRLAAADPQSFDQALLEYSYRQPTWGATVAVNHARKQSIPTARELMDEMLKRTN
ncbi:MAG: hypothetical protein JXB10_09745 [Pirellulales bacterium]|nr:hypothetical protein [Pirellulales bacterium]